MKRKLLLLTSIMLVVVLASSVVTAMVNKKEVKNDKLTIVTTFYPMYVIAKNVVGDTTGIDVVNLTEYQAGCLHDYQLTTGDMKKLVNADILIMNGGGMENFIQHVLETYPNLPMINASEGIEYLLTEGHSHDHEETDSHEDETEAHNDEVGTDANIHPEDEYNAHVWLNMNNYVKQIQIVQNELAKFNPENASRYQDNGTVYQDKVNAMKEEMETALTGTEHTQVVIFHDAFAYLAKELGLEVVHTINIDSESSLSAGEIAEVVNEVNQNQIQLLFTEEQYSTSIADNIAKETGATVYVIDSIVTGEMSKDGYITAMKKNLEVLKEAFGKE